MSPLLNAPYEERDLDLVRFRASLTDDKISMVVARSSVASDDELRRMREEMDADDVGLLDIFALRRSVAAWRSGSMGLSLDALDAVVLPPGASRSVNHDFRFVLYVALVVGVSEADIDARVGKTTRNARTAIERDLDSLQRATDVSQLGFVEVHSSYGLGVLRLSRTQSQTDPQWLEGASIIHSGAPIVHSPIDEAAPSVNLASLVVDIADAVDASGVLTGPIDVASLAARWFSEAPSASFVPTHGCLSFTVTTGENDGYVDVFVAELPTDIDPAELAQLATSNDLLDERVEATSRGAVIVLVCPAPFGVGEIDGLENFEDDTESDHDDDATNESLSADGRSDSPHRGPSLSELLAVADQVLAREVTIV